MISTPAASIRSSSTVRRHFVLGLPLFPLGPGVLQRYIISAILPQGVTNDIPSTLTGIFLSYIFLFY